MFGSFGKYLDVNLSTEDIDTYEIPESWVKKHIGGRGIAARILLAELTGKEQALEPENILIFASGPFQGLNIPGSGRHLVMSISPKTKSVNGAYAGGFFAQELGSSGFDGIIIRGRAASPKYLTIIEGKPALHDARDLWGKHIGDTEDLLKERHKGVRVSSIGQAGENLVKFACIINDYNRAAARPGFGAVMGSKNLKAVAIKGGLKKAVPDEAAFKEARKEFVRSLSSERYEGLGKYGTARNVVPLNVSGILPTANFREGVFDGAEDICGQKLYEQILTRRDSCTACPVRCKRVVKTEFNGEQVEEKYGGPEYETIAALGSFCLNKNLDAIALGNQKCNQYGLDTISAGNIMAFLMEYGERTGCNDYGLKWGDAEAMMTMLDKIALREGIGDEIARGLDYLAEKLDALDIAMMIKGQEVPMHDPRGKRAFGLDYATTPRGGQHNEGVHDSQLQVKPITPELGVTETMDRFSLEGKPRVAKIYEDLRSFSNSLIMCYFTTNNSGVYYNYPQVRALLTAVTGIEVDAQEMLAIGERNFILLKLHAARMGYTRDDDYLPKRLMEALPKGGSANKPIDEKLFQEKIDEFYQCRGYDYYGPTDQKLTDLGLAELAGIIRR